ncbi:hypothetical protein PIIN_10330 [Serendipita indica DSM 11827]|uniref:Uncharacterized protein n=1 Tax=Serendipita indica (strain DSM 11827) TaxID=1109443 RepID=G4TYE2_SERID|nr:hypothetical protein PIIN_10330 [Serendipita indica DSM 11827]
MARSSLTSNQCGYFGHLGVKQGVVGGPYSSLYILRDKRIWGADSRTFNAPGSSPSSILKPINSLICGTFHLDLADGTHKRLEGIKPWLLSFDVLRTHGHIGKQ